MKILMSSIEKLQKKYNPLRMKKIKAGKGTEVGR